MPEGVDYAIRVAHKMDSLFSGRGVPLRLEPEHGPAPKRRQAARLPFGPTQNPEHEGERARAVIHVGSACQSPGEDGVGAGH
jgi:hypothetical protein